MKKVVSQQLLIIFLSLFLAFTVYAQKPLITIFSADGYKFKVTMDGKEMNSEYSSRVEYMEMDHDWAKVMLEFKADDIPNISKTVQGKDADGKISSVSYEVKKSNKGKWKLAASSWKTLEEAEQDMAETTSYEEPVVATATSTVEQPAATSTTSITTKTVTTETSTPNTSTAVVNAENTSFNMSVDINDGTDNTSVGINVGVPGVTTTASETQTSYTTVTTTSTTSTISEEAVSAQEVEETTSGYSGSSNCSYPMSDNDFSNVKSSISSKDFEDSKMTVAKQVLNANCLQVSQVKEIMGLFDYEDSRLDFAKDAYPNTYDVNNYYQLNDVFEYESSIDELNEFINNQ